MERWQSEGCRKLDPLDQEGSCGEKQRSQSLGLGWKELLEGRKQAQVLGSSSALHPEPGLRLLGPVLSS